jgi:hypothetical protein
MGDAWQGKQSNEQKKPSAATAAAQKPSPCPSQVLIDALQEKPEAEEMAR